MAEFRLCVLCSSQAAQEEWRARAAHYPDLEIVPLLVAGSPWSALAAILSEHSGPHVLVCREDVWFGVGFEAALRALVSELDRDWPGWSICGNRGATWDGRAIEHTRFGYRPGLQTGAGPKPVLTVDDDLLLLNRSRIESFDLSQVPQTEERSFGIPLSLACLLNGSVPLVDRRLMAIRTDADAARRQARLVRGDAFRRFWRERFINDRLFTADGELDLSEDVDYVRLNLLAGLPPADFVDLYDQALARTRARRPSLTLCCRTQFKRPRLLARALHSFLAARLEARPLLDLKIALVTDTAESVTDAFLRNSGVRCISHQVRPARFSRTDLMLAAIEQVDTDYIWFVDDDDYVLPGAAVGLARSMVPGQPALVVGGAVVMNEPPESDSAAEPASFRRSYRAEDIFKVFAGANDYVPVCALVLPAALARQRLAGRRALGDYNEDYFVLLAVLTAPSIEVVPLDVDLCRISFCPDQTTAPSTDKARWHLWNSTFMLEILTSDDTNNPLLWQLSQRIP